MKWNAIEPSRSMFTSPGAGALVSWAQANNKMVREHTLLWHSQLPTRASSTTLVSTLAFVI